MSVEQIKSAIAELSLEERTELAAWFHVWADDEWDAQMKADIASGKLDQILREVDEDAHAGRLREMPDFEARLRAMSDDEVMPRWCSRSGSRRRGKGQ